MEELLQTMTVLSIEFHHSARQYCCLIATFFAGLIIQLLHQRSKVIVQSLRQHAGPGTKRACHVQLIHDGLANESALVGQLVQDVCQLCFYFEGDDSGFCVLLGHGKPWGRVSSVLNNNDSRGILSSGKPLSNELTCLFTTKHDAEMLI